MRKMTRGELVCNFTLIGVLLFTLIHILILTLNLFGVTNFSVPANFNYITAYIFVIVCLMLYILGFFVTRLKRVIFPAWIRTLFYIALFLFTNVYYILGFYSSIFGIIIFYSYLAFLISVLSVSVFCNTQKDEKNRLKASYRFISISVLSYSVTISTIAEILISAVKVIFFKNAATSTLLYSLVALVTMMIVSIILAIAYFVSLKKTKVFINGCLVKFKRKNSVQKSVKE